MTDFVGLGGGATTTNGAGAIATLVEGCSV